MKYLLLLGGIVILSGCGKLSLSVGGEAINLNNIFTKATGSQLVSGATQGVVTSNSYKVDSTVGIYTSKIETTTLNGYKVYQGAQGISVSQ
jgi:hypothetical protein